MKYKNIKEGYEAYLVFIVQMGGVAYFTPNEPMHKEFAMAVKRAQNSGVHIATLDCTVTKDSICAKDYVDIKL